jgi:murein tripeptide amidase MpaA
MFKKGLGFMTALLMTVSIVGTNVKAYSASDLSNASVTNIEVKNEKKNSDQSASVELKVSNSLLSMTESRIIEVEADFGYVSDLNKLQWTFGEKPFSDWKQWNAEAKAYSGAPFITFAEEPAVVGTTVKAKIKFDLLYGTTDLSPRSVRVLYPELINFYNMAVKDVSTGKTATKVMKLNVYDSYHKYDELKPALDEIFAQSKSDRYLEYQAIGKSAEGRDFHFVVLAKDKSSVDRYINYTVPLMINYPGALQKILLDGKFVDYKVPIFLNNIHPDEAPGIDAQIDVLRLLTTKDTIEYKTLDESNKEVTVSLNVKKLLDNVIFVMNLTENPDGRYYNVRQNIYGFDVNRDNGYQTQIESQILVQQIAKWNPISFLDLHGFVKGFLIEPCTPPHDPNYEYDLLINSMLEQANAMGKAGISNTKYDSYEIPYKDYGYGWDDGAPAYTATYAMHHGALGHTIEMPEINQDSNNAVVHAILASAKYVLDNKNKLINNQLEYFKRGVEGTDSKSVDEWLVNAKGESIGRQREEGKNFFPEYYMLPVDSSLQKNPLEIYNVVEYFSRNGIIVEKTESSITVDGTTYPEGTYIINMHQAKRGLANTVLYKGYDASDFEEMYAEIVMNFPALRGFDVYSTYTKNAFDKKSTPLSKVKKVILNSNNDAIRAVNKLLSEGKSVNVALKDGKGYEAGDYIVSETDLQEIRKDFLLDVTSFDNSVNVKKLEQTKVFSSGSKESTYVLQQLGFKLVNDIKESNIIVDDSGKADTSTIKAGKPYIGLGANALNFVKTNNLLPEFDYGVVGKYYEGLLESEVAADSMFTSGYEKNEPLYVVDGSYIKTVPKSSKVLARVSSNEKFFIAGWMPKHEIIKGQILAFTDNSQGYRITLFANTLTNKVHPQNSFRLLANAIFTSTSNLEEK